MGARIGRPPLKADVKRGGVIRFLVRPDERELYERAADLERVTLSEWMRRVLTRSAQRRVKARTRPST